VKKGILRPSEHWIVLEKRYADRKSRLGLGQNLKVVDDFCRLSSTRSSFAHFSKYSKVLDSEGEREQA